MSQGTSELMNYCFMTPIPWARPDLVLKGPLELITPASPILGTLTIHQLVRSLSPHPLFTTSLLAFVCSIHPAWWSC
jgi:hypothetical protein